MYYYHMKWLIVFTIALVQQSVVLSQDVKDGGKPLETLVSSYIETFTFNFGKDGSETERRVKRGDNSNYGQNGTHSLISSLNHKDIKAQEEFGSKDGISKNQHINGEMIQESKSKWETYNYDRNAESSEQKKMFVRSKQKYEAKMSKHRTNIKRPMKRGSRGSTKRENTRWSKQKKKVSSTTNLRIKGRKEHNFEEKVDPEWTSIFDHTAKLAGNQGNTSSAIERRSKPITHNNSANARKTNEFNVTDSGSDDNTAGATVDNSLLGQYPFVVAIIKEGEPLEVFAGSILSDNYVLTSGITVGDSPKERDPTAFSVVAGTITIDLKNREGWRKVTKIVVENPTVPNVAILTVDQPFKYGNTMAKKRISFEKFIGWRPCKVIGWGLDEIIGSDNVSELNATTFVQLHSELFTIDMDHCIQTYPNATEYELEHYMCVEYETEDETDCTADDSRVLVCDGCIVGFIAIAPNLEPCSEDGEIFKHIYPAMFMDVGTVFKWTRNYAPKIPVPPRKGKDKEVKTTPGTKSPNSGSNAFISLSMWSVFAIFVCK